MTVEEKSKSPDHSVSFPVISARITYKNAPVHVLEKFCFKDMREAHTMFRESGYSECVLLQTCNRVEVYAVSSNGNQDSQYLLETWCKIIGLEPRDFADVRVSEGLDAVNHLIRLASGLDSLVVGEDQILGQVRRAFEFSRTNRFSGQALAAIFEKAIRAGSRIRSATGINKGNVSVASIAINIAEEYFDDLKNKRIILIGTGEAATLVAKLLKTQNVEFMITSRTAERAKWFSETIAGTPVQFDEALETLHDADIVFVATTAPYLLVTNERIELAMQGRSDSGRGMLIFDLSNPRTVDERVEKIHGVKLVTMDQIGELADKNLRLRISEYESAEKLVVRELKSIDSNLRRMKAEPSIVSIFKTVDAIRQRELDKALLMLGKDQVLSERQLKTIEQLSYAIVEGILSGPMNNLRRQLSQSDKYNEEILQLVARLFNYEDEQQGQR